MAGVPRGPSNFDPWQGWEISARNPFLPVGEYTNEAGDVSAGFAMPSIVTEPANALARLLNTPAGTMPNPQNPEMQQDALTGLLSLYGGNAVSGMARGAGRNALESGMGAGNGVTLGDMVIAKYLDWKHPNEYSALDRPPLHPNEYKGLQTMPEGVFRDAGSADVAHYADLNRRSVETYGVGYEGLNPEQTRHIRDGIKPAPRFSVIDGGLLSDTGKPSPVGSAIGSALDMSPEARLARAREQGFDTNRVLYHGTPNQFDAFEPSKHGSSGPGVYVTPDRRHAAKFGDVKDLLLRGKYASFDDVPREVTDRPWYVDMFGSQGSPASRAAGWARENGYDGFRQDGYQTNVFDPSNIRSVNAAFDPARAGENGLLLSDTGRPSIMGSAVAASSEFDPYADIPPWLLGLDERVTY